MTKIATPQANDWDNYWSLDRTERFTKISWSKKRIMKILSRYFGKGSSILDAGCGSGFFSAYFCDEGADVVSLDYSKEALDIAKKLTQNKTITLQADLTDQAMSASVDRKFNLIFTDGLFEHFSDGVQDTIMTNLKNLLSDDGVIVTFVPNRFSPWELIRPFFMPGIEEDPFVLSGLMKLNERNGLSVGERGGINTIPFALSPDRLVGSWFGMLLYTIAKDDK
ncbi:MAG: 2-polyprenyl-3-methyl-5-hydroxy-6-metoxy-1,4-benzoquinol methylase [Lysobacterales bacterium]|jgi:2-polyprenyl-3-methyl-5-hydroxy-6-metoxy-1,4-benzoquinol methylase